MQDINGQPRNSNIAGLIFFYMKSGNHGTCALNAQVDNASFLSPSGDMTSGSLGG
jgi:hypothetical protein